MEIDNKFDIKQTVYLITDPEQLPHIVTGILIKEKTLIYECAIMANTDYYSDYELSSQKNVLIACGLEGKEKKN